MQSVKVKRAGHTYNNGQPYQRAAGRAAAAADVELRRTTGHPVLFGRPAPRQFVRVIKRELKIRCYSPNTVRSYVGAITKFLRWFGNAPHRVRIEDVREYLETLVDGGASSSWVSINLAAIRTAFDKMCFRDITLGLVTPRRPKRQPVVLSVNEVERLLKAATDLSDKLILGLMYATGMRVSEVARLRWRDIDFDRSTIRVVRGKGASDRLVMLPESFRGLLRGLSESAAGAEFLFASRGKRTERHVSPRTIQRAVRNAAHFAGITKQVTPHSLRHAFAIHLLENGTDIRFIQKLLGHRRLETTVIYTRVAKASVQRVISPIDRMKQAAGSASVGRMQIELTPDALNRSAAVEIALIDGSRSRKLPPMRVSLADNGWIELAMPAHDELFVALEQMSRPVRERVMSPEFYELIRTHTTTKFLKLCRRE